MLTSLAYDGLVAYRRADGVAGATLVGALATRPPPPSPDGRTYVFTLRKGLRYSDGSPVGRGTSARRWSASCAPRARSPPVLRRDRRRAGAACAGRPAATSRAGSSRMRPRGTITIHLTAPDAEFLHKLTMPFAFVVPAGTPARTAGDLAPPGTGPYRIAAWDSRRGGRLVRNPRFRPTAARPAGFADRIEFRRSDARRGRAQPSRRSSAAGGRDVLAPPFDSLLARGGLKALVARAPGQVHSVRRRARRGCSSTSGGRRSTTSASGGRSTSPPTAPRSSSWPAVPSSRPDLPDRPHGVPGLRAGLPLHRRPVARPRVDRAGPRARAPADRGVRDGGRDGRRRCVPVQRHRSAATSSRCCASSASMRGCACSPTRRTSPASRRPARAIRWAFVGWGADFISPSTFIDPNFTCARPGTQQREPLAPVRRRSDPRGGAARAATRRRTPRRPGRRSTAASSTSRRPCPRPTTAQ